ncbi:hypothetical protein PIB30_099515 [Stylosanthes scabra]|uniref:Uncharacterized protein n=1 Tax=Stylosanthes scabra TaxID=79078 RepID=A0ABU6UVV0_9FABA|nr:hypothetical protein [Stylosanthes scabra]
MAKKNVSGSTTKEKGRAKRIAKRLDKHSDSRCTPLKIRKIYDRLSPEKKALVDEITSVGEFLITSEKVGHAFGLNCRGDLFEKRQKDFEDKLNDEEKQALDLFKGKSLTFVQDMVKDCPIETDEQKRTFKRAFALFIQKSFLLPTSSAYISPVHLPVINDIDNTQGRNWAHHVNSFLINGIKEFHDQGSQAMKGCHFVLMIIYFREKYDGKSLNDPNFPAPWIQRWTGELMKEKIKAEDEDITRMIQRDKMRAQQQKTDKKRTEGEDENLEDDADGTESDTEEEEYHNVDDSETESESEEVQRERKSKRRQEESVM